jgi:arylsulfatase A-like enzyme
MASLEPWPTSYYSWPLVVNGVQTTETTYATQYTVDAAVQWVATAAEPWFCYVPLHTPHAPFHVPPAGTYSEDLTGLNPTVDVRQHYKAMVESMDAALGDLLAGLGDDLDRTTVIFVGDNGTPKEAAAGPFPGPLSKGTVYEGGVRVPLVVTGPLVREPGREVTALVNVVDLFPTLLQIADVDAGPLAAAGTKFDGVSLLPYLVDPAAPAQRSWIYTERFRANGAAPATMTWAVRAIRDTRYKLVEQLTGDELYDLALDPFEQNDLLSSSLTPAASAAYAALSSEIATLIASY